MHRFVVDAGRVDAEDLLRLYQGRLMVHALLDNLDILTDRQREVVTLYYRENHQQATIAAQLDITQQAVAGFASEIARILKPSGTYSVLEISLPESAILRVPYNWYLSKVIPIFGKLLLGDRVFILTSCHCVVQTNSIYVEHQVV